MTCEDDKATLKTPFFTFNGKVKQIAEIISLLSLCALCLLAYAFWVHGAEAAKDADKLQEQLQSNQKDQNENFKELTDVIKELARQARFQTCIAALPEEKREREYHAPNGTCARVAR